MFLHASFALCVVDLLSTESRRTKQNPYTWSEKKGPKRNENTLNLSMTEMWVWYSCNFIREVHFDESTLNLHKTRGNLSDERNEVGKSWKENIQSRCATEIWATVVMNRNI